MPGAPGMLSIESPRRAMTSITRSGGDAQDFLDLFRIGNQIVLGRIEHEDAVIDQLQHVLVAGNYIDKVLLLGGFAGEVPMTSSASNPASSRMGMR